MTSLPLLLTLDEAATALGGISVRTLEREIRDGQLAVVHVRGQRRIARADLEGYIARHRRYTSDTCPSANVVAFGTSASRSAESALSALLDRAARTRAPSRRSSASRRSTSV